MHAALSRPIPFPGAYAPICVREKKENRQKPKISGCENTGDFCIIQLPNVDFVTYLYPGGEIVRKSV